MSFRISFITISTGVSSWHDILKEKCFFCKKMLNLKEFILDGGGAFADTTFLTRLHEAFPGLETLSINGDMKLTDLGKRSCNLDYIESYCQLYDATWPRDKFIGVLKSLAKGRLISERLLGVIDFPKNNKKI